MKVYTIERIVMEGTSLADSLVLVYRTFENAYKQLMLMYTSALSYVDTEIFEEPSKECPQFAMSYDDDSVFESVVLRETEVREE